MSDENVAIEHNNDNETIQNMYELEKKMEEARQTMLLGLKNQTAQAKTKQQENEKQEPKLEIPIISDGLKYQYYDATNNLISESHEHTKLENIIAQKDKEIELLRKRLSESNKDYEKADKLQEQLYEAQRNLISINVERGQLAQENSRLKITLEQIERENEMLRIKLYEEFVQLMTLKKQVLDDVRTKFEDNKLLLKQNEQLRQQLTHHLDLVTKLDPDQLQVDSYGQITLRDLYHDESEQILQNNQLYNNIIELINKINNYQVDLEKLNRDIARQQKIKQSELSIREQFQQLQKQSQKSQKGESQNINLQVQSKMDNYDNDTQQIMTMINHSENLLNRSASQLQEERAYSNQSNKKLQQQMKRVKLNLSQNQQQINMNNIDDNANYAQQDPERNQSNHSNKNKYKSQASQRQNRINSSQSYGVLRSISQTNEQSLHSSNYHQQQSYEELKKELVQYNQLLADKELEMSRWKMEAEELKKHISQKKPVRESDEYIQAVSQLAYYRQLSNDQENRLKILSTENLGLQKKNQFLTTQVMQKSNTSQESLKQETQYYENLINLYKVHLRESGCNLDLLESQAKILSQSIMTPIEQIGAKQEATNIKGTQNIQSSLDIPKREVQSLGDVNNNFKIAMDLISIQISAINEKLAESGLQLYISNIGQILLQKSKGTITHFTKTQQNEIHFNNDRYAIADKLAHKFMEPENKPGEQNQSPSTDNKEDDFLKFQQLLKSIPSNAH